jgi:hypothetical protein
MRQFHFLCLIGDLQLFLIKIGKESLGREHHSKGYEFNRIQIEIIIIRVKDLLLALIITN